MIWSISCAVSPPGQQVGPAGGVGVRDTRAAGYLLDRRGQCCRRPDADDAGCGLEVIPALEALDLLLGDRAGVTGLPDAEADLAEPRLECLYVLPALALAK